MNTNLSGDEFPLSKLDFSPGLVSTEDNVVFGSPQSEEKFVHPLELAVVS